MAAQLGIRFEWMALFFTPAVIKVFSSFVLLSSNGVDLDDHDSSDV